MVRVTTPRSTLVTVTFRDPVVVDPETVMCTDKCVELVRLTDRIVIPVPNETIEVVHVPVWKPVPVMVIVWLV